MLNAARSQERSKCNVQLQSLRRMQLTCALFVSRSSEHSTQRDATRPFGGHCELLNAIPGARIARNRRPPPTTFFFLHQEGT